MKDERIYEPPHPENFGATLKWLDRLGYTVQWYSGDGWTYRKPKHIEDAYYNEALRYRAFKQ